MGAKGKELAGPILGIIGVTMYFIVVFFLLFFNLIDFLIMLSITAVGLIGAILGFTGKRVAGGALMLISGIIPYILYYIGFGEWFLIGWVFLFVLFAFDPILLILGGILGMALKSD